MWIEGLEQHRRAACATRAQMQKRAAESPPSCLKAKSQQPIAGLLRVHEMPAPVLLPARFIRLGAERLFLPVADGLNPVGADSRADQCVLHRAGTIVAERQVVFG